MIYIIAALSLVVVIETGIILVMLSAFRRLSVKTDMLIEFVQFLYSPDAENFMRKLGYIKAST